MAQVEISVAMCQRRYRRKKGREHRPSLGPAVWSLFLSQPPRTSVTWSTPHSWENASLSPSWLFDAPLFQGQRHPPHPGVLPVSYRKQYLGECSDMRDKADSHVITTPVSTAQVTVSTVAWSVACYPHSTPQSGCEVSGT